MSQGIATGRCHFRREMDQANHTVIRLLTAEALAEQIGQLDEERAAVAAETRLELCGERIVPVVGEIVVIADVEGGAGVRRVAEQKLAAGICRQGVVIDTRARKNKSAELVGGVK